jgi:dTDP-4-amino-4,6-dideoxygalactose transaminase
MRIQRTISSAAAPIPLKNLMHGLAGLFFNEKYIKIFEREIKEYFDVRHVFLVSSGKAALVLILQALKSLSPGRHRVLIPAYTCFSVPSAIVKAGLKVSLCDIDSSRYDFDCNLFEESINEDVLCVVPNHLFGIPANLEKVKSVCRKKGIFVIEDVAQAMGVTYKGKMLGTIGDAGFFSLGRGKNITCGSGGIIVTNSDKIAGAIEKEYLYLSSPKIMETLRDFIKVTVMSVFIHPSLFWLPAGLRFLRLGETIFHKDIKVKRLTGMEAGLLRYWQSRLEESNNIRKKNAEYFCKKLDLKTNNTLSIPYLRLPFLVKEKETRDRIYSLSCLKGLGISKMYPTAVDEIDEIKSQFNNNRIFPNARKISESLLTIPTQPFLSEKDKQRICELFKQVCFKCFSEEPDKNEQSMLINQLNVF